MSGPQARRPPIVLGGGSVMHYRWLTFTAVVSVVPAACAWAGQLVIVDDIPGTFMDITASGTILELGGNDEIVIVTTIGNEIFPSGSVVVANNGGLGFAFPPSNDLPPVNEHIPSSVAFGGGRALLPFWDDIDDKNGDVLELQTEEMLIIQWNDLILTGTGDTVTFQVQIFGDPVGGPDAVQAGTSTWQRRPVGQVNTFADVFTIGDVDLDGFDDVLVRSTDGKIVQWFRHPGAADLEPIFPPPDAVPDRFNFPWPVFTLTEFDDQEPEAIAIGDVTGDGQVEVLIAAGGAVFWYDGTSAETVFDPWSPNTIIQDSAPDAADAAAAGGLAPGSGVGVTGVDTATVINTLLVVDLDQDGRADIVGTLNRRSGAGLSDDRLVWYRNTHTDGEE